MLSPQIPFAAEVLLAICILAAIQLTAVTAAGFVSGVSIRQISFGVGPRLLQFRKFAVRAIPFAGWVKFKDTRSDEYVDASAARTTHDAYNHQPRIVQAAMALAGPASLIALALVLGYERGLSEVLTGFRQIFVGSLQPLTVAQAYIGATQSFAANGGFGALTAGDEPVAWQASLLKWAMLPWCALLLGWLVAFVYYVART